jgi:hypothetical protein
MYYEKEHDPNCPYCYGRGQYYTHSSDCDDDLCNLSGGYHDCVGQVVECDCRSELQIRCDRLQAENERLLQIIQNIYDDIPGPACDAMHDNGVFDEWINYKKAKAKEGDR